MRIIIGATGLALFAGVCFWIGIPEHLLVPLVIGAWSLANLGGFI